jgi:ankyrin repeat protein
MNNDDNALLSAFGNYSRNKYENECVIESLINNGANIFIKTDNQMNMLMYASMRGMEKIVELLLKNGLNVNDVDGQGKTALMYAAKHDGISNDNLNIVNLLINSGADVNIKNKKGRTALIYGAWRANRNSEKIVEILLKHGAEVNIRDNQDYTALSYITCWEYKKNVIQILLNYGANINEQNVLFSAIQNASSGGLEKHFEFIKFLFENGANPNIQDENGYTPLMYVVGYRSYGPFYKYPENKKIELAQEMIKYGSNIFIKNNYGDIAISIALQYNNDKIADFLKNEMNKILINNEKNIFVEI